MLSRVAENIYWMGRYVERAENTARLINVNTNLLLDLPRRVPFGWGALIDITGYGATFSERYEAADERSVMRFMLGDPHNPCSIIRVLDNARENARTVRDIIPREAWEQLNDLCLRAKNDLQSGVARGGRHDYLRWIILGCQTITGMLAGTMTHDLGYDFLRMGRNLERADMTTRIIDVRSANLLPDQIEHDVTYDNIQWMSVLKSLTAYQMYRRAMQVRVRRPDVLRFLFKDARFPRAFYHTVCEVENCLQDLPRNDASLRLVVQLQRLVSDSHPEALSQSELHDFIDELQLRLAEINDQITATYFALGAQQGHAAA